VAPRFLRIVSPRFSPEVVGGVETLLRRLALQLVERGWDIEVLTTTAEDEATWGGDLPPFEDDHGVRVRRFRPLLRRAPRFDAVSRVFFRTPPGFRPEALWVRAQGPWAPRLVRTLATLPPGPTLAAPYLFHPVLAGLPAAPHPRILLPAAHPERPLKLRVVTRAVAAADALWYSAPEERELLEAAHPVAAGKPSAIGTVGIEAGRGNGARFRRATGIQGPFFIHGGRQARGKGAEVLLAGIAALRRRHPDVRLVLTGDGARHDDGAVVHLGRLDPQLFADAIAASIAVVVPGTMESLSLLALEAWSSGRPCLLRGDSAVLAGQARRSGGALLFDDAAGFAERSATLLEQPQLAAQLGRRGRAYVRREHSPESVVRRLEELIDTATAARS
jgi:glycosyltransferase involved in cell wall biosynthesis